VREIPVEEVAPLRVEHDGLELVRALELDAPPGRALLLLARPDEVLARAVVEGHAHRQGQEQVALAAHHDAYLPRAVVLLVGLRRLLRGAREEGAALALEEAGGLGAALLSHLDAPVDALRGAEELPEVPGHVGARALLEGVEEVVGGR